MCHSLYSEQILSFKGQPSCSRQTFYWSPFQITFGIKQLALNLQTYATTEEKCFRGNDIYALTCQLSVQNSKPATEHIENWL